MRGWEGCEGGPACLWVRCPGRRSLGPVCILVLHSAFMDEVPCLRLPWSRYKEKARPLPVNKAAQPAGRWVTADAESRKRVVFLKPLQHWKLKTIVVSNIPHKEMSPNCCRFFYTFPFHLFLFIFGCNGSSLLRKDFL